MQLNRRVKLDLLFILAICVNASLIITKLTSFQDLSLWDETNYLSRGIRADFKQFDLSPLYVGWYYLISKLSDDPIKIFYLNCSALSLIIPILVYICSRQIGANLFISFLIAIFALNSAIILDTPKVNLFASACLLLGFSLSCLVKSDKKWRVLVLGLILASQTRAEFYLALYLLLLIFTFKSHLSTSDKTLLAISIFCIGLTTSILTSSRADIGFKQGFAVNYSKWTEINYNPWTHYQDILEINFNNRDTNLLSAVLSNPQLLLKHCAENLKNYSSNSINYMLPTYLENKLLGLLCILAIVVFLFKNKTTIINNYELKYFLILSAVTIIATCISNCLIFTMPRYLSSQHLILLILLALTLSNNKIIKKLSDKSNFHFTALLLISILNFSYSNSLIISDSKALELVELVNDLKLAKLKQPIVMFEGLGGICTYLQPDCKFLWRQNINEGESLENFFNANQVNAILINDELQNELHFAQDTYWLKLLSQPESLGFSKIPLAHSNLTVLRKN